MDFTAGHKILALKKTYLVVGKGDPYLNEERMKEFDLLAAQLGIVPKKILFEGKHEIDEKVIARLIWNSREETKKWGSRKGAKLAKKNLYLKIVRHSDNTIFNQGNIKIG